MAVARFFATAWGRGLRAALGVALLALAYLGAPWWVAALGGLFILVAVFNVCGLAVLFGGPWDGRKAGVHHSGA